MTEVEELRIKNEGLSRRLSRLEEQNVRLIKRIGEMREQRQRALACIRVSSMQPLVRLELIAKTLRESPHKPEEPKP